MTNKEQDFWTELRFGITRSEIIDAYCDWIEPKRYDLGTPLTIIEGQAGFLTPEVIVLDFKLVIPKEIHEMNETEWMNLLQLKMAAINLNGNLLEITLV